jgi:hypothetical protein
LVLALWGLQQKRAWLAGAVLPWLLIKPHITLVPVLTLMAIFWFRGPRRALFWAGISLVGLLMVSTLAIPGWYEPIVRGNLPNALTQNLDDSGQVTQIRVLTTLPHWLKQFGLSPSAVWILSGVVAVAGIGLLIWAWQRKAEAPYLVALSVVVGLAITPYAVQYDYVLLALGLLWVFREFPLVSPRRRVIGLLILAFALSVPIWEKWLSDGYWLVLALGALLVLLGWSRIGSTPQGAEP